jgi:signal transduction histidine kinase
MDESTLKNAKILIVDDEAGNTCLMTNFLDRIGYARLQSINNSATIFEKIECFAPDLILLDLVMPGLDGFEILEAVRANRLTKDQVPVLVITGDASAANKRRALRAGATDLLTKPFDPSEVNMRIRNLLQARFLRMEIEAQNCLLEDRVRERTRQLEQALEDVQKAQEQMLQQERLSAFAAMAGGVVHDFSNALMAVIGYSDILLHAKGQKLSDHNTALEYLQIINTAGRDAADVVSRLRDFYRPREDADAFETIDVNQLVRQSILLTKPKWSAARGKVVGRITVVPQLEKIGAIQGNAADLREMLTNLIFNAVDAMADGGVITLQTRCERSDAIILVTDTGAGMTEAVRERCLDPFFSTKGDKGTGLGLPMVSGIVKRHQGTMTIESEPGSGTTFKITLPAVVLRHGHTRDEEQDSSTVKRQLAAA